MARVTYENGRLRAYISGLPHKADRLASRLAARGEALVKEQIASVGAVDTGAMLNSVTHQRQAAAVWVLMVGASYGHYVNYGTWKMAARPFFEPALLLLQREVQQMAREELAP
jgi:HK97 gp10 family phage protein